MKNMLSIFLVFTSLCGFSQTNFEIELYDSCEVIRQGLPLPSAWAGGMNAPQFSEIDLNFDGVLDLFVFDREYHTVKTFINDGIQGQISYTYAPEYASRFPQNMENFVLLRDFNCDGRPDIFTSIPAGLMVYKNISNQLDGVQFEVYTNQLNAQVGSIISNIYVLGDAIPLIQDVNNDGFLDIVAFDNFYSHPFFYKNVSTNCDTMEFVQTGCWGQFNVNSITDSIILGATCKNAGVSGQAGPRHFGTYTLAAWDMDADDDLELFLGDAEQTELKALYNGGDVWTANITSVDYNFPSSSVPVDIQLSALAHYIDLNNDGVGEMIVTRNNYQNSIDKDNVFLYSNSGLDNQPIFNYTRNNLFVKDMVELGTGAHPRFVDINNDGKLDIVSGNYGYFDASDSTYTSQLAYYQNIGTNQLPKYILIDDDYMQLSQYGMQNICPTFGDLDNDGDLDLLIGEKTGDMHYFENTAAPGSQPNFVLTSSPFFSLSTLGYSTPVLIDLTGDTVLDILAGREDGTLSLFKNFGNAGAPIFHIDTVIQNFASFQIGSGNGYFGEGYTVPTYGFVDTTGLANLIIGHRRGYLVVIENTYNNINAPWEIVDTIDIRSSRTSPDIADINNDGKYELLFGEWTGGMELYKFDVEDTTTVIPPDTTIPKSLVTFTVEIPDSLNVPTDPTGGGVWLMGNFTDLTWDSLPIKMDSIAPFTYQISDSITPEIVRFKFSIGMPGSGLEIEESANFQSLGCGTTGLNGGFDRFIIRSENDTSVAYCWNKCGDTCVYVPDDSTSVVENYQKQKLFEFYPNPSQHTVFIVNKGTEKLNVELISLNGTLLQSVSLSEKQERINVEGLPTGIYILKATSRNNLWVEKLIIE